MLVNDIGELCTPQGAGTVSEIILHVVNLDNGANGGSKITLSTKGTPQDYLRAAVRLLGQRVGWGNLAPTLFEREAADAICNGNQSLLVELLNDLRSIATPASKKEHIDTGTTRKVSGRRSQQQQEQLNTTGRGRGDTKEQGSPVPRPPSSMYSSRVRAPPSSFSSSSSSTTKNTSSDRSRRRQRQGAAGAGTGNTGESKRTQKTMDAAASSADGLSGLSNDELENARERVARMLAEAEATLEMEDNKNQERKTKQQRKIRQQHSQQRRPALSTQTWVAPSNGWNQSTETLTLQQRQRGGATSGASSSLTSSSSNQNQNTTASAVLSTRHLHHSQHTANVVKRVERDRGGRHRPAATSFHNREFQNGKKKVDKNGLVMDGMWDPTFAPSLRRLTQLGFSPNKAARRRRGTSERGDSDQRGAYYYHDSVNAPSEVSCHASSGVSGSSDVEDGTDGDGVSYTVRRRASTLRSGVRKWKEDLRTPSKKGSVRRRGNGTALQFEGTNSATATTPGGSRHTVFKGPSDVSHALSNKQERIMSWMIQLGVRPCPQKKRKELTGALVSASFADGVLLCSLVANVEVRAGGRSANVVPGLTGQLTLEGTNFKPRTTGACTSNLNNALKILRHRKNMPTRHLWAASALRNGDVTVVWELLSDIEQEYSANRVMHGRKRRTKKKMTKKQKQQQKKKMMRMKQMQGGEQQHQQTMTPQKSGGPAFNSGSTLRGSSRASLSACMSMQGMSMQRRPFDETQRKPFGLLDPERGGDDMHGEEHNPYGMEDDRIAGGFGRSSAKKGKSTQRRRRTRQLSTTER